MEALELLRCGGRHQQIVRDLPIDGDISAHESAGMSSALSTKNNCMEVFCRCRHARAFVFSSRKFCASFESSLASALVQRSNFGTRLGSFFRLGFSFAFSAVLHSVERWLA